ncbi:hypothetical protein [Thiolapillus sp.]
MEVSVPVETVEEIRRARLARARAAALLLELHPEEDEIPLSWPQLLMVPEWCFWEEPRRKHLVLVAGALFVSPAMRLWIDADRIRQARILLGEAAFEAILASEVAPKDLLRVPKEECLESIFSSAGESVLLSSLEPSLQHHCRFILGKNADMIPQPVATLLANEAMAVQQKVQQDKDVDDGAPGRKE